MPSAPSLDETYRAQLLDHIWAENPMNAFISHMIDVVEKFAPGDYLIEDLPPPLGVDKQYRIATPGFEFPEPVRQTLQESDLLPLGSVVDLIFDDDPGQLPLIKHYKLKFTCDI